MWTLSLCVVVMLTSSVVALRGNVLTVRDLLDIANIKPEDIEDAIKLDNLSNFHDLGELIDNAFAQLVGVANDDASGNDTSSEDQDRTKTQSDEKFREKKAASACLRLDFAGIGELIDGFFGATGLSETFLKLLNLPKTIIDFILGLPLSLLTMLPANLLSGLGGFLGNSGLFGGLLGGKDGGFLGGALGGKDGGFLGGALGGKDGGLLGGTSGTSGGLLGGALGGISKAVQQATSTATGGTGTGGLLSIGRRDAEEDHLIKKRFLLSDTIQLVYELVNLVFTAITNIIKEILLVTSAVLLAPKTFIGDFPWLAPLKWILKLSPLSNFWPLNIITRSLENTNGLRDLASLNVKTGNSNIADDGFLVGLSVDYDKTPATGFLSSFTNGLFGLDATGFSLDALKDGLKNTGFVGQSKVIESFGKLLQNKVSDAGDVITEGITKSSELNSAIANKVTEFHNAAIEGTKQATNLLNSVIGTVTGSGGETTGTSGITGFLTGNTGGSSPSTSGTGFLTGSTGGSNPSTSGLTGFLTGITGGSSPSTSGTGFLTGSTGGSNPSTSGLTGFLTGGTGFLNTPSPLVAQSPTVKALVSSTPAPVPATTAKTGLLSGFLSGTLLDASKKTGFLQGK